MSKSFAFFCALVLCSAVTSFEISRAADSRPAWQVEWEKTVKAAEEEGALVTYMTQAFEPVFREVFQKKFPKIKVTLVTGRGPDLSQRVMSERRAEKFAVDLYVSGNISPLTVFHKAKILEPVNHCRCFLKFWILPLGTRASITTTIRRIGSSSSSKGRQEAARLLTIPSW